MLAFTNKRMRGDTLIEVIFAITVFSLVVVSSLSIMNQGAATSQRALEITMVRNEIDAQAETLRFINSSFLAAYQPDATSSASYSGAAKQWMLIKERAAGVTTATPFGNTIACPAAAPTGSFVLNTHTASIAPANIMTTASTFSQVAYDSFDNVTASNGVWIEAIHSTSSVDNEQKKMGYIDFYIRSCWDSPGQSVPVTLGTIVRLYEPMYTVAVVPSVIVPTPPPSVPSVPAAPVVSVVGTAGNITSYSWLATTCDSGGTASYQYRYRVDSGFVSAWNSTSVLTSSYNTANEGYQYTLDVQTRCTNISGTSAWSATGSASYIRPVSPPGSISWSIIKATTTNVNLMATSSCSSSPSIYLFSRDDAYITPTYNGWSWWWNDTHIGGWYSSSHSGWLDDSWAWRGNTITVSIGMNPLQSGFPWKMAVELRCQNYVTGRTSTSTGRVESGDLITP